MSFQSRVSVYQTFVRTAFLKMLAYRLRYYTGILTYLILVSVNYFIWKAIFTGTEAGAKINGFTLSEMVTYVTMGWIARSLYYSTIDVEINELVRTGEIRAYLLRPVNFHLMMISQASGESIFRLLFFTWPIAIVLFFLFPISPPATILDGGLFLVATMLSFFVFAEFNFIVGLLAFSLKSIDGVMRAKYFLIQLLSGLILPLTFFPEYLQPVLNALPFRAIASIPLQFYLGKIPPAEMLSTILFPVVWVIALIVVSQLLWRRAVRQLTVQGG